MALPDYEIIRANTFSYGNAEDCALCRILTHIAPSGDLLSRRVIYEKAYGELHPAIGLIQGCSTKGCVNPRHASRIAPRWMDSERTFVSRPTSLDYMGLTTQAPGPVKDPKIEPVDPVKSENARLLEQCRKKREQEDELVQEKRLEKECVRKAKRVAFLASKYEVAIFKEMILSPMQQLELKRQAEDAKERVAIKRAIALERAAYKRIASTRRKSEYRAKRKAGFPVETKEQRTLRLRARGLALAEAAALRQASKIESYEKNFYSENLRLRIVSRCSAPSANSGCWLFQGAQRNGYGVVSLRKNKTAYVHRVIYELTYGPLAKGARLTPVCGNKTCCKPEHWSLMPK